MDAQKTETAQRIQFSVRVWTRLATKTYISFNFLIIKALLLISPPFFVLSHLLLHTPLLSILLFNMDWISVFFWAHVEWSQMLFTVRSVDFHISNMDIVSGKWHCCVFWMEFFFMLNGIKIAFVSVDLGWWKKSCRRDCNTVMCCVAKLGNLFLVIWVEGPYNINLQFKWHYREIYLLQLCCSDFSFTLWKPLPCLACQLSWCSHAK